MKGTAHMLFYVTTLRTSGHARNKGVMLVTGVWSSLQWCGARNRGVVLITGVVTLVTWPGTLLTRSYMRENGGEAPEQDAVGASWRQGG